VEQPGRHGRDQMGADRQPTVGLAEHRHVARVPAERGRVAGHPAQRRLLVLEAEGPRSLQPGMAERPEDPQPVVDGHHHDVPGEGERAAVEEAAAADGPVAVDPDHHRPGRGRGGRPGRGDVQAQAVLVQAGHLGVGGGLLGADGAWPGGVPWLGPGRHRLRRPPAEPSPGGGGVRDALEEPVLVGHRPPDRARVRLHDVRRCTHLDPRARRHVAGGTIVATPDAVDNRGTPRSRGPTRTRACR
jgi:hypothetical protein